MKSALAVLAVLAGSLSAALPAAAEARVVTSMPVVAATLSGGELTLRLTDGVVFNMPRGHARTIVVTAFDAQGAVVAKREAVVRRRLSYASVKLSPDFASADHIEITGR